MAEGQSPMFAKFGKRFPTGTVLFREGDRGEEMFILQSGKVKISKKIRGVEKTLATLEKGEFFGEMAILNAKPRSATAETIEDCDMLVIDRKTFETLLRSNVEIAIRFIKRLADRLRETNEQMEALVVRDNTSRLVSILAKQVREGSGGAVPLSIEDLAGMAGIEGGQARMILEKLASVRILALTQDDKVAISSKEPDLTKRMNNPEVMERINEKMTLLGPAVGRYISEMLNPVVIRTIGILFRRGKFPEPPEELMMNPEYEIDCVYQLAQAQRRSELNSLVSGLSMVAQVAQFAPDVLDKVSPDKTVDEHWSITGAPVRVLREDGEVQAIREQRGKIAQQQIAMQLAEQGAGVIEKGSKVDVNLAKRSSGVPLRLHTSYFLLPG